MIIENKKNNLRLTIKSNNNNTVYRLESIDEVGDVVSTIKDTFNLAVLLSTMQGTSDMRAFKKQLILDDTL